MAEKISVSVRRLVEFILSSGDIDNTKGYKDPDVMQEGSRIHRKIQKSKMLNLHHHMMFMGLILK